MLKIVREMGVGVMSQVDVRTQSPFASFDWGERKEVTKTFAGSYETRAAQVYLRAYPQSVRTACLGSVVPIDVATPLTFAKTADKAQESTFSACAADSVCHTAFPNLHDEFRQVLARLESGVVRVSLPGRTGTVPMHRGRVVEWFRAMLYRSETAAIVPWLIHRACVGDWSPLVEGILSDARARRGLEFWPVFLDHVGDDGERLVGECSR